MNILKLSLLYAFSALGLSAVAFTYYVFLPKYYVDVIGVSAFWFGIIVIFTRLGDAIIDPLIGRFVDSYPKYRQKIIGIFAIPLGLSLVALANPNFLFDPLVWFLLFSIIFYFSWSAFSVPYQAIGLNLSADYHERTKILGTREGFLLLGTVLAALLPLIINYLLGEPTASFAYLTAVSLVYLVILVCGSLIISFLLPNQTFVSLDSSSKQLGFLKLLGFYRFRILLITYVLTSFGSTLSGAMILFYIDHVLESELGNQFIFFYFLGAVIFIPFWIHWSKKVDKQKAWLHGLIISTVSFLGVLFLGPGDQYIYLTIILVSSFGLGGAMIVPASLQADVAEQASLKTNQNLDAQMIGYWSLAKKVSAALAAGIAFPILDFIGYQSGQEPSSLVKIGLVILYAVVPACCYIGAIYFAYRYKDES